MTIKYFKIYCILRGVQKFFFHPNKQLKFTKLQLSDYEILEKLLYFKRSFLVCRQDDMNSLLFKQPSFFNAYTTAVDSFKHSLQKGLLPYAIGCALFISSQINLKSMFLRFRLKSMFLRFLF